MKQRIRSMAAALLLGLGLAPADAGVITGGLYMTPDFGVAETGPKPLSDPRLSVSVANFFADPNEADRYYFFGYVGSQGMLETFDEIATFSLTNVTADPLDVYFVVEYEGGMIINFDGGGDTEATPGYLRLGYSVHNPDVGYLLERTHTLRSRWYSPGDRWGAYEYPLYDDTEWFQFPLEAGATTTFTFSIEGLAFMPLPLPAGGGLLLTALLVPFAGRAVTGARRRRG